MSNPKQKEQRKKRIADKKKHGEYIDPIKELKRAYAEPQRVAYVGKKGYV